MKRRIYELDICRIIVLLTLPFIHIFEFLGDMYGYSDILSIEATSSCNLIVEVLCIFVAPVFVIFMGINMANTRRNSALDFFKRGIFLIILEFILNVVRYEISGIVALPFANSEDGRTLILDTMLLGIFNSDILALAGLSFLIIALFKKLNFKSWMLLVFSIIIFAVDFILNETVMASIDSSMNGVISNILGNFIYINENSTFPVTEWLIFVTTGYLLGIKLNKIDKKKETKLFIYTSLISLLLFSCCLVYTIIKEESIIESLCQAASPRSMTPLCLIAEISLSLLFTSIIYWICYIFKINDHKKACDFVKDFSNNTTYFYFIQWSIIGWIMMFGIALGYGSKIIPVWGVLLLYVVISLLSYYLADPVKKIFIKLSKKLSLN